MRNRDRRSIRRHIVNCVAILCAGILAVSLVRSSQDANQVRTEVHAVQLAAATLSPGPSTKVVAQQNDTDRTTPTASALPPLLGSIIGVALLFSPLIVGLIVCALCVVAVYAVNLTGLVLGELIYQLRQSPPIAAAAKASAPGTQPRTAAAGSKRPNRAPERNKPGRVTVGPAQRSTSKRSAATTRGPRGHSARPSAARSAPSS